MQIKLHPLSNGQDYGWSILRSVFDFFFPYAKNGDFEYIRAEASMHYNPEIQKVVVQFYTFRAFFLHFFLTYLSNPVRDLLHLRFTLAQLRLVAMIALLLADNSVSLPIFIGAIALDTHAQGGALNTVSYTVTGANPFLIAFVEGSQNNTDNISAVSYNGVALTNVDKLSTGAAGSAFQYSWIKMSPASGAHSFATTGTSTNYYILSYSGVKSTGQPDAHNTFNGGSGSATSITLSTTTVTDNSWVAIHFRSEGGSATYSAGANTTFRDNITSGASADTNGVVHPAGAVSQSVSWVGGVTFDSALSIAFSPAPAGGGLFLTFN